MTLEGDTWWRGDSPLTDSLVVGPSPVPTPVLTLAAVDAWDGHGKHVVTWSDWLGLLQVVAGELLTQAAVPRDYVDFLVPHQLHWHEFRRAGDYALELSQIFSVDNTYGARLVLHKDGAVLQYQPDTGTSIAVVANDASITATMPVITDDVLAEHGFYMEVSPDALAVMDAEEEAAEARYRAECERDAEALLYGDE